MVVVVVVVTFAGRIVGNVHDGVTTTIRGSAWGVDDDDDDKEVVGGGVPYYY